MFNSNFDNIKRAAPTVCFSVKAALFMLFTAISLFCLSCLNCIHAMPVLLIAVLALHFQSVQNTLHLLECCDTSRYKRKTEFIMNHSHHAKHSFHACRVTVYKQQLE